MASNCTRVEFKLNRSSICHSVESNIIIFVATTCFFSANPAHCFSPAQIFFVWIFQSFQATLQCATIASGHHHGVVCHYVHRISFWSAGNHFCFFVILLKHSQVIVVFLNIFLTHLVFCWSCDFRFPFTLHSTSLFLACVVSIGLFTVTLVVSSSHRSTRVGHRLLGFQSGSGLFSFVVTSPLVLSSHPPMPSAASIQLSLLPSNQCHDPHRPSHSGYYLFLAFCQIYCDHHSLQFAIISAWLLFNFSSLRSHRQDHGSHCDCPSNPITCVIAIVFASTLVVSLSFIVSWKQSLSLAHALLFVHTHLFFAIYCSQYLARHAERVQFCRSQEAS